MTMIKKYIAEFLEKNGEYEYSSTFLLKTNIKPEDALHNIALEFYSGDSEYNMEDSIYYFNGGEVSIRLGNFQEIDNKVFSALSGFLPVFNQVKKMEFSDTVTIGYVQDDGDFKILAALNNSSKEIEADDWAGQVIGIADFYNSKGINVEILDRQDVENSVCLDEI